MRKTRDLYANRHRATLTFGADASTAIYETFETGMNVGQQNPMKWVILGASIQPKYNTVPAAIALTDVTFKAQILLGEQSAMVDPDDSKLITSCCFTFDIETSGGLNMIWPIVFPILSPLPVFSKQLTFAILGANKACLNSTAWGIELWYVTAPIAQEEIVEYLAAFGQL